MFTQGINKISLGCLKVEQLHDLSPRANIDQQICHVLQHLFDRLLPKKNGINVKKLTSLLTLQYKRTVCASKAILYHLTLKADSMEQAHRMFCIESCPKAERSPALLSTVK